MVFKSNCIHLKGARLNDLETNFKLKHMPCFPVIERPFSRGAFRISSTFHTLRWILQQFVPEQK